MLQHSIYSVISPEGCASILMKDAAKAPEAAEALKLTAKHALELGVIDSVISEPEGGAHRSVDLTAMGIKKVLKQDLATLSKLSGNELKAQRVEKFMRMGHVGHGPDLLRDAH
jgi:acetyl-CoA carboxylase carboxyl transferase subunit alpha